MRLQFQKGDILAIAVVLILAVLISAAYIPHKNAPAGYAEIYRNGEKVQTVSLDTPQEFTMEFRYSNTIVVKDGKIAITESDCPGEDCVHSGWIGSTGRSIVCLPNELEIRIIAMDDAVDYVVG